MDSGGDHPERAATGTKLQKKAKLSFCKRCVEGKMHRKSFKPVGEICSIRTTVHIKSYTYHISVASCCTEKRNTKKFMSIRVLITLMFLINLLTSPELSLVCTALLRMHYHDMNPHCHSSERMCYQIWEYRTTLLYSESTYVLCTWGPSITNQDSY